MSDPAMEEATRADAALGALGTASGDTEGASPVLRSFVAGRWHEAQRGFRDVTDPSTEAVVARVSSDGVDFREVIDHARQVGGPALRAMTFAERGAMLRTVSKALREHRAELLALSARTNGTTEPDGAFDIDGATGTLAYYASVGRSLGERTTLEAGDGAQLARDESFYGRHLWVSRRGAAIAINAFNFPAWGFAEKAACAWLAGMPVIVKPATATAPVAARVVEIALATGALPNGALQMICGGTGDLLDRLDGQDVFSFTGSADTAAKLKDRDSIRHTNPRINVEADSLNAAVLAPGVAPAEEPADGEDGSATWKLFLRDVSREMRQKTGQKCTAIRRIFVPRDDLDRVQEALVETLERIVVGDPDHEGVTMGPLATADQLADAIDGVAALCQQVDRVYGSGERIDGQGAPTGKGQFFGPTLLRADDARRATSVHEREVFAPVATLLPYDGSTTEAAALVGLGGGTLVTSVYGDDASWIDEFVHEVAPHTGRVYVGTESAAGSAPGSGIAMPQSLHGGPGRAGGGEELGGRIGVERYMQRVAVQGHRERVDAIAGCDTESPSA